MSNDEKKSKIVIEFLARLAGSIDCFVSKYFESQLVASNVVEAPFFIHWDGGKEYVPGNVEIRLDDIGDRSKLISNIDEDKLTDWIIQQLEEIPETERVKKTVANEFAWTKQIPIDIVKTLQKEKKNENAK